MTRLIPPFFNASGGAALERPGLKSRGTLKSNPESYREILEPEELNLKEELAES
jgi:hypothetical protein